MNVVIILVSSSSPSPVISATKICLSLYFIHRNASQLPSSFNIKVAHFSYRITSAACLAKQISVHALPSLLDCEHPEDQMWVLCHALILPWAMLALTYQSGQQHSEMSSDSLLSKQGRNQVSNTKGGIEGQTMN